MSIRSSPAAIRFFNVFRDRAKDILATDDQEVMNHALAESGLVWNIAGLEPEIHQLDEDAFHCYPSTITGTIDTMGLTVGMLPHALFPRVQKGMASAPYVKHLLRPEDNAARIPELKAAGCWLLDE